MTQILQKAFQAWRAWRYQRAISRQQFGSKTVSEIFTETYVRRYWKSRESVSGIGSELGQTAHLRASLPALFQQYQIQSLLDLPCGDFNWMQHIDLSGIKYTGGDIVEAIIQQNQSKYSSPNCQFIHIDLLSDPLPDADCVLIRDCLVHFSLAHIEQALANLKSSRIRYLLTTSFTEREKNEDILTGYWRPINLQKAPFHFPEPLFCLNEGCTEAKGAFADKSLCLWEL